MLVIINEFGYLHLILYMAQLTKTFVLVHPFILIVIAFNNEMP